MISLLGDVDDVGIEILGSASLTVVLLVSLAFRLPWGAVGAAAAVSVTVLP